MKKLEVFGFVVSIAISVYLYREVKELTEILTKEKSLSSKSSVATNDRTRIKNTKTKKGKGLARLQGFRVGHVQDVDVGHGQKLRLITKALKPLVFEVPNFLNNKEINFMLDKAIKQSLENSEVRSGLQKSPEFKRSEGRGKAAEPLARFDYWDTNKDGYIGIEECMKAAAKYNGQLAPVEDDIRKMFETIETSAFDDEVISEEEWNQLDTIVIQDQFNYWAVYDPRFRIRFSEQTWLHWHLDETGVLNGIRERVTKLTRLPREIVYGGEPIQVAHYLPRGHYNAHYDSETHLRTDVPCCHQYKNGQSDGTGQCRICRYITIMTYMNDVEEGGETAFVSADNSTFDKDRDHDKLNLSKYCKEASLYVKPKKGTAVFWYNHHIDANTGWLGDMDSHGLHGGCDVIRGEKWISNVWLPAPYEDGFDTPSVYLRDDFEKYQ
eukprot:Seg624.1 transcript_id=Seg624.1/GoldUCD/mRNA.D3Y31 product="Transmembrane prolyl 4-hydroxylase" protein_id=Seg624.1/GoldUCD/D3Y31